MPRPPIGEKAMTPAERQRRHRDIVTAKPMTKSEREDLAKLIRNREKVMKSAARERSAELLAEFEQQMASVYSYDQDEVWKSATEAAAAAVAVAQQAIAERCSEMGIPARFAPNVGAAGARMPSRTGEPSCGQSLKAGSRRLRNQPAPRSRCCASTRSRRSSPMD